MVGSRTSTRPDFVELFVEAAERYAVTVASSDMQARIPACPGWTTYDLTCHLGNTHAWAATIVETGAEAVEQNDEPRSRKAKVVSEWYAGKAEDLYEALRFVDPARACWNFAFGEGRAEFWRRRQLHETTVHTIDLDAACGRTTHVAAEVAADGIDEVLTVFLHRMHSRGRPATLSAPVCLEATDVGRAWTVSPRPAVADPTGAVPTQPRGSSSEAAPALVSGPPVVVDRRHPRADRVTGTADQLYRVLWKRAEWEDLELTGDEPRIAAFLDSPLVP